MKNTAKRILAILILLSTLLTLFGCGEWKTYRHGEFVYKLPKSMKKLSMPPEYADFVYGNEDGAEYCAFFYTPDQLFGEFYLEKNCTTKEYADFYLRYQGCYTDVVQNYNAETGVTVQTYILDNDREHLFFYDYIIRNENVLVHLYMDVDADKREEYEPIFEYWTTLCYLK
ncbi:MAG: hypothetical protein J6V09_03060 [Clostridia bacterium]|nr:hypothetical protein [Clostridia bacterium]